MTQTTPDLRPRAAGLSMLAGMAVIGCIDNFIGPMSTHIGLWQFYVMRTVLALPLIVMMSLLGFGTLRPIRLWAVALRGLLLAGAMCFYFGALAFVPLPQALAGLFTSPVFILLITAIVLRQKVGPWRIAAVGMGFVGILLVINPWGQNWQMAAVMPVFGGFLYALSAIATRTICAGESVISMLAGTFLAQGLVGLLALPFLPVGGDGFVTMGWVWPVPWEAQSYLLLQAVGSVVGVALLIRAYALGEASYVAVFEYSVFVFGAVFAWLFFAQIPPVLAISGIVLIAWAGIVIAWRSKAVNA